MKSDKEFPNGFPSWQQTHFEAVQAITEEWLKDEPAGRVGEMHAANGHSGLYDLAEELTDKFEALHAGREWDGDFYDEVEAFLFAELYPGGREIKHPLSSTKKFFVKDMSGREWTTTVDTEGLRPFENDGICRDGDQTLMEWAEETEVGGTMDRESYHITRIE